jgi:hypothetical protein
MNQVDLDINNYSYSELLDIFKLPTIDKKQSITKMNEKMNLIKDSCSNDIYCFFNKAYNLLLCVNNLFQNNVILNINDEKTINNYIEKMKKIDEFEKYETSQLLLLINADSNPDNLNQYLQEEEEDDLEISKIKSNKYTPAINKGQSVVNDIYNNSVAPGKLNSIKRVTQLKNLNLNSCFRNNYNSTSPCDFFYTMPGEIKNVVSLKLASIEIPNAWYLFSSLKKNNVFTITIKIKNKITSHLITIYDGNYDSDSIQSFLNSNYFCDKQEEDDILHSLNSNPLKYIKFSIDSYSFKSRFEILENRPEHFSFSILFTEEETSQNRMNTLGWTLGFREKNYNNIIDSLISEGLFDAGGDRYIYICINDYQYNTNILNIVSLEKSILTEDVIAKIPMINGKLSLVIDNNSNPLTKTRHYNGPVNISRFHIKIIDKFGSIIDLNNMDFSITLELEILYESFNFSNVFS